MAVSTAYSAIFVFGSSGVGMSLIYVDAAADREITCKSLLNVAVF